MKKILIPVAVIIVILMITAIILSNTGSGNSGTYHTHEDGSTHYDVTEETEYHVHDDGETHYDEH